MNTPSKYVYSFICTLVLVVSANLRAETGDDNPTGPTGMFDGNITTGCSYDPYTRNAVRSVTDIVVSGAVGTKPLAFTRVANSRGGFSGLFGGSGFWQHSYSWVVADEPASFPNPNTLPTAYTIHFPDGRVIRFTSATGTPAGDAGDTKFRGPIGLSERLTPLTVAGGSIFLIETDGSQVKFQATVTSCGTGCYYRKYQTVQIIDRFGLITTLSYNADGTLNKVTEPAGRWLQLFYIAGPLISSVQSSDGRQVIYTYKSASFSPGAPVYTYLDTVTYYSDPTIGTTFYIYKAPNVPDAFGIYSGPPALAYCDDAMYDGPMKQIAYDYLHYNVDPYAAYGELLSEKHQTTAEPVSTISSGISGVDLTRTEVRGDGPSRTFFYRSQYGVGHILGSYTGFVPTEPSTFLGYNESNYLTSFTRNGHVTSMIREVITGRLTSLTHPPDVNGIRSSVYYAYTDPLNPYYLANTKDELLHQTIYTRDSLHRITQIAYPDSAYETFSNYNVFNQALTHRLTSGGTEYYTYDTRGLNQTWQNAVNLATNVTHYYYDNLDRVSGIKDPLGFQTDFVNNLRGEVTKTTHPPDAVTGVRYYTTNHYNTYGTLDMVTDELGHPTVYDRDYYQRLTQVTNALGQITVNSYLPWGKTSSYLTTSNFVFSTTAPSLKKVYNYCDNEFRKTQVTQAPGTSDQAISYFTYDGAGNLKTAKDPRGNQTTLNYDQRERLMTGFLGEGTSYVYDFGGNMTQMTDLKGAIYGFGYDFLNRKTSATYPVDAGNVVRTETWSYDEAGNLVQYKNPNDQIQQFTYDNRNRRIESEWQFGFPDITTVYDAASRVTSVATADGTTVGFGYDNANRQTSEDQTVTGFPLRHIAMTVDADGNRASISLAGVYTLYYQYTQRQQVSLVSTSTAAYYGFTYDLHGNITKQQDKVQGLDSTNFNYDALDRVTLCTQTGANDVSFATSHYDYDLNNNIQDTYRDEQAGKGERFGYDFANQLTSAVYNADNVQTPNPTNYDRSVSYTCDALNRTSMNDNGAVTNYTPNGLNQLTAVTGMASTYDQNFNQKKINGWVYTYDPARRVGNAANSTTGQSTQFSYDGLNRCVKRVTDGVTTLITYDGWKPIAEWDMAGTRTAWNMYGPGPDQILMRYRASDANYLHYHADQFGNVKFLLNSANTGIEKYTYDAFGAPKITDWAGNVRTDSAYGNRFMFTGREYLSTIGIYDYRNRMYSPLLGRFLQNDPLGFDANDNNLYRYCGNNPTNASDPDGTDAIAQHDGGYIYVLRSGLNPKILAGNGGNWIYNSEARFTQQCATGGQFLAGGFVHGAIHDVPSTGTWRQGLAVGADTRWGTLIATGWQLGEYPSLTSADYQAKYPGSPTNHVGIFLGYADGKITILDQSTGQALTVEGKDAAGWNVVKVPNSKDGPYEDASTQSYMKATRSPAGLAAIQRYGAATARLIYGSINGLAFAGSIDGFQTWSGLGGLPIGGTSPSNAEATALP